MSKAIIFSAPSGAGKTTIVQALIQSGLPLGFSVSATSRSPRGQEQQGVDYCFFTAAEFKERIDRNEFVEWEEVYDGVFYGTLRSELERVWQAGKAIVFDVDVKGGVNLKKIFGDHALSIFIQPPSIEVLESRLRNRHTETEDNIRKRLDRARYELTFAPQFDCVVVNDDLNMAIKQAIEVVSAFLK